MIAIDFDNTICNTTETWLQIYNKKTLANLKMQVLTNYDVNSFIPEKDHDLFNGILGTSEFWDLLSPLPNSIECIRALSEKDEIKVVTSGNPKCWDYLIGWLNKYFPYINQEDVIYIKDKSLIRCDFLIDDCWQQLQNASKKTHTCMVVYPWNTPLVTAGRGVDYIGLPNNFWNKDAFIGGLGLEGVVPY